MFRWFFYLGRCWKQKLFPILVFLLQRVPAFVIAGHRLPELIPAGFFDVLMIPNPGVNDGLQILQGDKPCCCACETETAADTFFTIRQLDK